MTPNFVALPDRSDYKRTWEQLSGTSDEAKMFVAGYTDEEQLTLTGTYTVELLERLVGIRPTDVVLEIGCGIGRVGKLLAPKCRQWIGTDISGNMVRHARQRLGDLPNVTFVELGRLGLHEIPDESIDVVYCTVVFMHLYEWDRYAYVKEAFRVLKTGGRAFFDNVDITSPHGWKVFTDSAAFDVNNRPAQIGMTSSGDELLTYGQKAGFADVRIHRWVDAWVGVTGVKP